MAQTASKRLSQLAKDLNVRMSIITTFLADQDIHIENKPTTILNSDLVRLIESELTDNTRSNKNISSQEEAENYHVLSNTINHDYATTIETIKSIRHRKGNPSSVFKFFGTEKYHIESLEESYIFFSSPEAFNDPFDCSLDTIEFSKNKSNYRKQRESIFRTRYETLGVCCFSRRNDSILMWAHYANSHRGFCLEYHVQANGTALAPLDINYTSKFSVVNFEKHPEKSIFNMIFTKSKDWSYEEELRLFTGGFTDLQSRKHKIPIQALKAVYLGSKCSDILKDRIIDILVSRYKSKIPLYKATSNPNSFGLSFNKLSY